MTKRIVGFDLARALAVFGMVAVNFKVAMGAETSGPAWLVSLAGLLDGRAAATFVVLAGAGISLLSQKARISGDSDLIAQNRNTLLKRALFLFVAGSLYTPIWPADILHFYGVYIAVAAFMLCAPARRLWAWSAALVLGFCLLLLLFNYDQGWNWQTVTYEDLWSPSGLVRHIFFNGFHPVVPWLAFLLLGMILGRHDLGSAPVRRRVFAWGVAIALVAEILSLILVNILSEGETAAVQKEIAAVFGTAPMPPLPLYMLAGAGTACAVITACISLGLRYGDSAWLRPLISTGQLALTLYVGHVIIGMGALDELGKLNNQTLLFAVGSAVLFCLAGVVFAHFWRLRFKRGPLEAVMRALTDPKTSRVRSAIK